MAVEIGKKYPKIKWGEADFKWNTSPNNPSYPRYTWDEVELIQHAAGDIVNEPWLKWEDKKKEKLVKLICKVQGKTYSKSKSIKKHTIKISDIKIAAEKILGIEVVTENIKF